MWSSRWHFTIKSVAGAPYCIKSYGLSQLDTMAKSTMTETVVSWGRGGTAAAMAQNEQTTLASSQRWVGNVWSCDRSPRDRHTFYPATKFVLSLFSLRVWHLYMKTFAETGILQSVSGTPRGVYVGYSIAMPCSDWCRDKKVKVEHTRSQSVGFRSWSRLLAVSLQVMWVINPAVGCHYFPPGLQLPRNP